MNSLGRTIETIRRFDLFKQLVALGLFCIAIFAYVQDLRALPNATDETEATIADLNTAAIINTPNNPYKVGDRIVLAGTGLPNTNVAIYVDDLEIDRDGVDPDGMWSMQVNRELDAGTYQVSVVAIDEAGNTRQQVGSRTQLVIVEADATATPLPTMAPPEITNEISRTIRLGDPLMLSGNGVPGTIVIVLNGVVELGKAIVGANGAWSLDLELAQPGEYDLMFAASDADGVQRALGDRIALTVLAPTPTQPTISIDELPPGFTGGDVTIRGEADRDAVIGIVYDGKMFDVVSTDTTGVYSYTAVFNTPGEHTVAAQVINPNSDIVVISEPIAFTIEGEESAENGLSPSATEFVTPTVTLPALGIEFYGGIVPLAGSATSGSTVVVLINNRTIGVVSADVDATWSYSTTLSVPETYNIYVRVVDGSGRTVASSNVETLVVQSAIERDDADIAENPCAAGFPPGEFLPDQKYRVAECETLTSIARRASVSVDELVAINPGVENPSFIKPGQIINLP